MSKEILLAAALNSLNPSPDYLESTKARNIIEDTANQIASLHQTEYTRTQLRWLGWWNAWDTWKSANDINGWYFFDRDTDWWNFKQDVWESIRIFGWVNWDISWRNYSLNIDWIWYIWSPSDRHNMDTDGIRTDMIEITFTNNRQLHDCVMSLGWWIQLFGDYWLKDLQNGYHRLIQSREFATQYDPQNTESLHLYGGFMCDVWTIKWINSHIYTESTLPIWEWVAHTEAWIQFEKPLTSKLRLNTWVKWMYTRYPDHNTFNMHPYDTIDGMNIQWEIWIKYQLNETLDFEASTNKTISWGKPWESFIGFNKRF